MGFRLPCATKLRMYLTYDPETGKLCWKCSPRRGFAPGSEAGHIHKAKKQYRVFAFEGRQLYAHRVIWKIMTGEDAKGQIDHIDGDGLNNKWSNLREATPEQNMQNRCMQRNNTSGVKGVHYSAHHKKWRAVLTSENKVKQLGFYKTVNDAASVINEARLKMHGNFARFA